MTMRLAARLPLVALALLVLLLAPWACSTAQETEHPSLSPAATVGSPACNSDAASCAAAAALSAEVSPPPPPPPGDVRDRLVLFVSIAIKGHAQPLLRIAREMKLRGYRVAFATHESGREWVASHQVPFLSAGAFPISADDLRTKLKTMTWDSSNFRGILTMFNDIYVAAARPMFDELLPQLQPQPPALIVMDIASIGAQDLAHKLRVPHIINSPSIMFDLGGSPSYVPAWGTGFRADMSLWNRCMNILFPRLLSVALTPPFMQLNKMRWELALTPYRSQHDIFKGTRVMLNTAFGLEHAQPLAPLVEPVGPILPLDFNRSAPNVGAQLHLWFDKRAAASPSTALPAVVYLNLGTMSYIDAWQSEALVEGLTMRSDEAQIKVLWVLPSDQRNVLPPNLPPNFKVKSPSTVSSLDVLAHPAVRLVVSHCGMVSAQEALVHGKPLLCIPFHVDQPDVAARVVDAGAGRLLNKNQLSATLVHDAVLALLGNTTYSRRAARVGRLLERAGGTARAVDIIDATLRLGTGHVETLDLALPWHKTAMLDVWTVAVALVCLLALVVRVLWLLLYFALSETLAVVGNVIFGPPEGDAAASASATATPAAATTAEPPASGGGSSTASEKGDEKTKAPDAQPQQQQQQHKQSPPSSGATEKTH